MSLVALHGLNYLVVVILPVGKQKVASQCLAPPVVSDMGQNTHYFPASSRVLGMASMMGEGRDGKEADKNIQGH